MTTPYERTRTLVQTAAFLESLSADLSLPERIRGEAEGLLRHYPTMSNLQLLARIEAHAVGSTLLTTEFDATWAER